MMTNPESNVKETSDTGSASGNVDPQLDDGSAQVSDLVGLDERLLANPDGEEDHPASQCE